MSQPPATDAASAAAPEPPGFLRSLGLFWLYTLLRFGLFGLLWLLLWLVGVGWLLAAAIAVVLSIPLAWVLLARPRAAFAANIEQRVNAHVSRTEAFNDRLAGEDEVDAADAADGPTGEPGSGAETTR